MKIGHFPTFNASFYDETQGIQNFENACASQLYIGIFNYIAHICFPMQKEKDNSKM